MNRYATHGLVADALAGKTILVLTPLTSMIRPAMDEIIRGTLDDADPDLYRVRRTNGEQRIEFRGGGRIHFQSARGSIRGMSADIVYLDADADREMTDAWRDLHAVTHPDGEIIRA